MLIECCVIVSAVYTIKRHDIHSKNLKRHRKHKSVTFYIMVRLDHFLLEIQAAMCFVILTPHRDERHADNR